MAKFLTIKHHKPESIERVEKLGEVAHAAGYLVMSEWGIEHERCGVDALASIELGATAISRAAVLVEHAATFGYLYRRTSLHEYLIMPRSASSTDAAVRQ